MGKLHTETLENLQNGAAKTCNTGDLVSSRVEIETFYMGKDKKDNLENPTYIARGDHKN